jgi:hypothetical protein
VELTRLPGQEKKAFKLYDFGLSGCVTVSGGIPLRSFIIVETAHSFGGKESHVSGKS